MATDTSETPLPATDSHDCAATSLLDRPPIWTFNCSKCHRLSEFTERNLSYDSGNGNAYFCAHCAHRCSDVSCQSCEVFIFVVSTTCWACQNKDIKPEYYLRIMNPKWGKNCNACGYGVDSNCVISWRVGKQLYLPQPIGRDYQCYWHRVKAKDGGDSWIDVDEPVVGEGLGEKFEGSVKLTDKEYWRFW